MRLPQFLIPCLFATTLAAQDATWLGAWRLVSSPDIAGAIDQCTEEMSFIKRPIARSRLKKLNPAYARLVLGRSGSEFALIRGLREQLTSLIAGQQDLLAISEKMADLRERAPELKKRQTTLRDALVLAPLPAIPAPRTRLFDLAMPPAPPTDDLRLRAEALMTTAAGRLEAGAKDDAVARQREVITSLRELDTILARWSNELAQKALGVSALVSDATNRAGVLEQLETRQIGLLEQTEKAALKEKNPEALTGDQQSLVTEVEEFRKELSGDKSGPAKEALPLLGRVEAVRVRAALRADVRRASPRRGLSAGHDQPRPRPGRHGGGARRSSGCGPGPPHGFRRDRSAGPPAPRAQQPAAPPSSPTGARPAPQTAVGGGERRGRCAGGACRA